MTVQSHHTMNTYTSSGFRSVRAENIRSAAEIFANRHARRQYGPRGYCRVYQMAGYAQDMSLAEFDAFIGLNGPERGTTVGRNVRFTILRAS